MNSDKSQEELKAMTFEEWWKGHEKHFEKNVHDKQSVSKMGFEGGRKSRDAEVLALVAALKVAKEALELAQIEGRHFFQGSWVDKAMTEALSAITPLLAEQEEKE